MQNTFLKQQQNPIKIGILHAFADVEKNAANKNELGENKISNKEKNFKELVEEYSSLGKRLEHLTKDEQYKICLAYIEDKYSGWLFNKEVNPSEEVDVPLDIKTLRLLKDNIYNSKARAFELIREAVIDSRSRDISEVLDDAIEAERSRYEDNYPFGSVHPSLLNAFKRSVHAE